jgi:hypothetical protein
MQSKVCEQYEKQTTNSSSDLNNYYCFMKSAVSPIIVGIRKNVAKACAFRQFESHLSNRSEDIKFVAGEALWKCNVTIFDGERVKKFF